MTMTLTQLPVELVVYLEFSKLPTPQVLLPINALLCAPAKANNCVLLVFSTMKMATRLAAIPRNDGVCTCVVWQVAPNEHN